MFHRLKIIQWNNETLGALLLLVPLGNTSFLGIPMVRAFFGEEGIPYIAIMAGLSPKLTAALVGFGIFLSFTTLPLLFQM